MFSLSRDNLRRYDNIQKRRDIYSAHIHLSTSVISFSFHVLLALGDLGDLSVCLSVYHIIDLCAFFQQKVTSEHRSPIPLHSLHLDAFFQHRLAKYLPCAITELPPTLQRSHVEAQIPIFIAFGLKSLCRSN